MYSVTSYTHKTLTHKTSDALGLQIEYKPLFWLWSWYRVVCVVCCRAASSSPSERGAVQFHDAGDEGFLEFVNATRWEPQHWHWTQPASSSLSLCLPTMTVKPEFIFSFFLFIISFHSHRLPKQAVPKQTRLCCLLLCSAANGEQGCRVTAEHIEAFSKIFTRWRLGIAE